MKHIENTAGCAPLTENTAGCAPLTALLADPNGRSGFEVRRTWAFVTAARPRLSPVAYRFLEALATEIPGMPFLDRQFHAHGDDWGAVAKVCEEVIGVYDEWSRCRIPGPLLLAPPAGLEPTLLTLEDIAGSVMLYRDTAYEEALHALPGMPAPRLTALASSHDATANTVGNARGLSGAFSDVLKADAERAWLPMEAANDSWTELAAAARHSASAGEPDDALEERFVISWIQGGVRMELREENDSIVVTSDNPDVVKAAMHMVWLGRTFPFAPESGAFESRVVLGLDRRKVSFLLQCAEDPRKSALEALPCLLA